jgi:hypothetical protein
MGETGDGDGDGDPGDGDGDSGDGDGDSGDGDGDSGDGDGDSGDGDGDPFEGWCDICANPPEYSGCGVVDGPPQRVWLSTTEHSFDLDETCTVSSVSSTLVSLDCETDDPTIHIDLVVPWVPNLEIGATMRLVASGNPQNRQYSIVNWRLEHEDNTLALAGHEGVGIGPGSIGMGAIPITLDTGACAPECNSDAAYQDVGIVVEHEGEQVTVFGGDQGTVGNLHIWVPEARNVVCDDFTQYAWGSSNVFISAG